MFRVAIIIDTFNAVHDSKRKDLHSSEERREKAEKNGRSKAERNLCNKCSKKKRLQKVF